jgi:hypothetical protein
MARMTLEQKQQFFNTYGVMPITDDDVPDSDKIFMTEGEVLRVEAVVAKQKAKQYLIDTDWYVARKVETGIDIPEDILTKRAQARLDASS